MADESLFGSSSIEALVEEQTAPSFRFFTCVARYIGQLHYGCGDRACREILCHSGRVNASSRPIRRYTIVSARAIAFYMCLISKQHSHFCSYYNHSRSNAKLDGDGNGQKRLDATSLVQSLAMTTILQNTNEEGLPFALEFHMKNVNAELLRLHRRLDGLEGLLEYRIRKGASVCSNAELLNVLADCLCSVARMHLTGESSNVIKRVMSAITCRSLLCDEITDKQELRRIRPVKRQDMWALILATPAPENVHGWSAEQMIALVNKLRQFFIEHWTGAVVLHINSQCVEAIRGIDCITDRLNAVERNTAPFEYNLDTVYTHLDWLEAARSWLDLPQKTGRYYHIFQSKYLLPADLRCVFFRAVNHLSMRDAVSRSKHVGRLGELVQNRRHDSTIGSSSRPEGIHTIPERIRCALQYYLLFGVKRVHILKDAFDSLWQRRRFELFRPLRIRLNEIDALDFGQDLGGIQVEFFNLLCREAFEGSAQMFVTSELHGNRWLRPGSLQPLYMFEMFGCLLGLAVYNGITLPIDLPQIFYKMVLNEAGHASTQDLEDTWPDMAASLTICDNDVEDLDLEFVFPLEANGLRLGVRIREQCHDRCVVEANVHYISIVDGSSASQRNTDRLTVAGLGIADAWPGWHFIDAPDPAEQVTKENKDKFIAEYCDWLVRGSVMPQLDAFTKGFTGLFADTEALQLLTPSWRLKAHIEGVHTIDMGALKKIAEYEGGYDRNSLPVVWFWEILSSWDFDMQKKLVKFVTAIDRVPWGGESSLKFVVEKAYSAGHHDDDNPTSLPTSSTCFGTIALPEYATKAVMEEKLRLAVEQGSEGFGLG